MPSISIALVVVIAAIGQQQLYFVNADAGLPYAGSLYNCGETNSATDKAGTPWTYEFKCKDGDQCVSGTCMNCPNKMDKPEDAAYCNIARSQVKRCKEGFCEENYDLSRHCGFAFKRAVDGQTYYMNCEGGYDCSDGLCTDGSKPIITRCNKDNLEVNAGACMGSGCQGVECQKMNYQPPQ